MFTSVDRTHLFYEWERALRGWEITQYPVDPELRFVPCLKNHPHLLRQNQELQDDGRHETMLSRVSELFGSKQPPAPPPEEELEISFPEPVELDPASEIVEFHLLLPPEFKSKQSLMQQILLSLSFVRYPLSFEVIGTHEQIVVVLACSQHDAPQVYDQLTAHAPECVIDQTNDYLVQQFAELGVSAVVDFGLENEVMLPLASESSGYDLLIGIMGALSRLAEGECGVLQIIFRVTRQNWSEALIDAVTDYDGTSFFADAPNLKPQTEQKVSSPLCACVIRIAAHTAYRQRCHELIRAVSGTVMQFSSNGNSLMPLSNESYPDDVHIKDALLRATHRTGMLLNLSELTLFAHLPDASVRIPKLKRIAKHTKAAPKIAQSSGIYLGVNEHHGHTNSVKLQTEHRLRHMHLIGSSGTGKSTMLLNMIIQDMQAGNGVAVLDPHGDLIGTLLGYVPDERMDDVIVFDPADEEFPIGFNIIDAHSELEKILLASDLTSVFKRLSTSWGDQMNSVLANGISAMLESTQGGTLHTLRRFLVDKSFRKEFLTTVTDPENVFYWEREFPLLRGSPQAPVLTRLDTFLRPKPIRHMVAQQENKVDFSQIMQGKKIFLAKLSQGTIGTENSYLMGAFLVTKLNQIAYSRQALKQNKRENFFLYIDEFHNFITPSMESILSGARKFNLSMILAHQELRQIESKDTNVSASVMSNPYTRVCFRLGDSDAKRLQSGFSFFEAKDLQSLGIGEAIARVERSEFDFNLSTPPLPDIGQRQAEEKSQTIIRQSQQRYGLPREQVEELINQSISGGSRDIKRAATNTPVKSTEAEAASTLKGRGGQQHKEIQKLVKDTAEKYGFKAMIEKPSDNGRGHVDVVLEKEDLQIACEISVTTSVDHEVVNVEKCFDAGFDQVMCFSDNPETLRGLKSAVENIERLKSKSISFVPSSLIEKHLSSLSKKTVKKYWAMMSMSITATFHPNLK